MLENMLMDICGSDMFDSILETLSINLFSGGTYSTAYTMVKNLNANVIQPVAVMLLFIYFMLAIVDKCSSENFTWEQLWRQMAMLLAAKYLIEHGFEILEYLFDIGMALASDVERYALGSAGSMENALTKQDATELIEAFRENIDFIDMNFFKDVILFFYILIPWLFSWLIGLGVKIICYTRVIEIYARATFAPIALSDFFHSGLQSAGWRYLKNFLAVALQGAMLLAIACIFSTLFTNLVSNATDKDLFSFVGTYIAFYAASLMIMFKSLSLTKELVGTG